GARLLVTNFSMRSPPYLGVRRQGILTLDLGNCLPYIFHDLRIQFNLCHDHDNARSRVVEDLHALVWHLQFLQYGLHILGRKPVVSQKGVGMHHVAAPLSTNASIIRVAMPEWPPLGTVVRHWNAKRYCPLTGTTYTPKRTNWPVESAVAEVCRVSNPLK